MLDLPRVSLRRIGGSDFKYRCYKGLYIEFGIKTAHGQLQGYSHLRYRWQGRLAQVERMSSERPNRDGRTVIPLLVYNSGDAQLPLPCRLKIG